MDPAQETVAKVSGLYRIISSQLSTIQAIGYSAFVSAPKNTLVFCFNVQKQMIIFPVHCLRAVYVAMRNITTRIFSRSSPPDVAQFLTGYANPSYQQILQATTDIRRAAIQTVINQQTASQRIAQYRLDIENWSLETNRKISATIVMTEEDKELIRKLADIVKYLRSMRSKKIKLTDAYLKQIRNLVSKDRISQAELRYLKENFERLNGINAMFHEGRRSRLNSLNNASKTNKRFMKTVLQNEGLQDFVPDPRVDIGLLNNVLDICERSRSQDDTTEKEENDSEKKLDEILEVTETVKNMLIELSMQLKDTDMNTKLVELKTKCEEQMNMLKEVEWERNALKTKLEVLEMLIQDQETFLDNRSVERESQNDVPLIDLDFSSLDSDLPSCSS